MIQFPVFKAIFLACLLGLFFTLSSATDYAYTTNINPYQGKAYMFGHWRQYRHFSKDDRYFISFSSFNNEFRASAVHIYFFKDGNVHADFTIETNNQTYVDGVIQYFESFVPPTTLFDMEFVITFTFDSTAVKLNDSAFIEFRFYNGETNHIMFKDVIHMLPSPVLNPAQVDQYPSNLHQVGSDHESQDDYPLHRLSSLIPSTVSLSSSSSPSPSPSPSLDLISMDFPQSHIHYRATCGKVKDCEDSQNFHIHLRNINLHNQDNTRFVDPMLTFRFIGPVTMFTLDNNNLPIFNPPSLTCIVNTEEVQFRRLDTLHSHAPHNIPMYGANGLHHLYHKHDVYIQCPHAYLHYQFAVEPYGSIITPLYRTIVQVTIADEHRLQKERDIAYLNRPSITMEYSAVNAPNTVNLIAHTTEVDPHAPQGTLMPVFIHGVLDVYGKVAPTDTLTICPISMTLDIPYVVFTYTDEHAQKRLLYQKLVTLDQTTGCYFIEPFSQLTKDISVVFGHPLEYVIRAPLGQFSEHGASIYMEYVAHGVSDHHNSNNNSNHDHGGNDPTPTVYRITVPVLTHPPMAKTITTSTPVYHADTILQGFPYSAPIDQFTMQEVTHEFTSIGIAVTGNQFLHTGPSFACMVTINDTDKDSITPMRLATPTGDIMYKFQLSKAMAVGSTCKIMCADLYMISTAYAFFVQESMVKMVGFADDDKVIFMNTYEFEVEKAANAFNPDPPPPPDDDDDDDGDNDDGDNDGGDDDGDHDDETKKKKHLSTGAVAAIVISFVIAALASGGYLFYRYRRDQKRREDVISLLDDQYTALQ